MADGFEKQKRLAEYLGDEPATSIAGRAEQAFKEQQRKEEERVNALKQRHETGAARRGSLKGKWEGAMEANKSPDSSNTDNSKSSPVSSIAGRAEQAFKEQQAKEEERLNALKQGHGTDGRPLSERRGSLKGKWEGAIEANKTAADANNATNRTTPINSIAGRAEQAFKEQQAKEEERLNALKQGHGTDGRPLSERRGSLKGKWEGVLQNTRQAEADKVETKKDETKAQFKTTEGTGLVSQRIGQWEDLIMVNVASSERVDATAAAALALINARWDSAAAKEAGKPVDAGDLFSSAGAAGGGGQQGGQDALFAGADVSIIPAHIVELYPEVELFYSKDTKLYDLKASSGYSYLLPFSKEYSSKPLSLPCGLSSSNEQSESASTATDDEKPNEVAVDVVALVMNAGSGNTFLAVTVIGRNSQAAENDAFARECGLGISYVYGLKKISVFDPSGGHVVKNIFVYLVEKVVDGQVVDAVVVDAPVVIAGAGSDEADELISSPVEAVEAAHVATEEPTGVYMDASEQTPAVPVEEKTAEVSVDCGVGVTDGGSDAVVDALVNATSDEALVEKVGSFSSATGPEEASSTDEQSAPVTPSKPDEGDDTWRTQYTPPSSLRRTAEDAEADGDFSGYDDDSDLSSGGALASSEFYTFGRSKSTAQAISQSKYISPAAAGDRASYVPDSPSLIVNSSSAGKDFLGGCGHWTREDEASADMLPFGSETTIAVAIEDIISITCTSSALVMHCDNKHRRYSNVAKPVLRRLSWSSRQSSEDCNVIGAGMSSDSVSVVVTGTLKHVLISTPSLYVLNHDKLFEYLRGAAMSGWMFKWPMRTQKYGRRTKRFFILRDGNLSYHRKPPASMKDYIYGSDNYAMSSLKLDKSTTVAKGYKRFWSCVVTQTDSDTLWMKGANKEQEDRWIEAISTSVSNLNRMHSPVFLTKPTIECVWHHESNKSFKAIAMDAVSSTVASFSSVNYNNKYANVLHYVHVALFSFEYHHGSAANSSIMGSATSASGEGRKVYSIDLGGDELERKQLEIVPVGVGVNSQYEEITSKLSCIKLLCASGTAPMDFTPNSSSRKEVVRNTNNIVVVLGGSAGFITIGTIGVRQVVDNDIVDTSVLAQERHSVSLVNRGQEVTEEEVVYCDMDISRHYHTLQQQQIATSAAISKAKGTPLKGTKDATVETAPTRAGNYYSSTYHSMHSSITAVATNPDRMIFVSGDSHGGVGLWKIVRHEPHKIRTYSDSNIHNFKYEAMSGQRDNHLTVTARLECFINVNKLTNSLGDPTDPFANDGEYMERVNNIQFLPSGSHVAVSTTRRFLLLGLTSLTQETAVGVNSERSRLSSSFTCGVLRFINTNGLTMDSPSLVTWTVLDRSAPSVKSMFGICLETEETSSKEGVAGGVSDCKITVWKVLGGDENVGTDGDNRKCTLYRFKWTAEMLNLAMQRSQPVVNEDNSNTLTFL